MTLILYVAGFVLLVLAALGVPTSRYSLVALGLACWLLASHLLPLVAEK